MDANRNIRNSKYEHDPFLYSLLFFFLYATHHQGYFLSENDSDRLYQVSYRIFQNFLRLSVNQFAFYVLCVCMCACQSSIQCLHAYEKLSFI